MNQPRMCCVLCLLAQFETLWTVARQAPLSMGVPQAGILKWVATSPSRGSSKHRDWAQVSCFAGRFFTIWAAREAQPYVFMCVCGGCVCMCVCVCMHVCILNCSVMLNSNLMDCSLPGSSVHGIFQARIPKPAAIPRDLPDPTKGSDPCLPHWQVDYWSLYRLGKYI